MHKPVSLRLSVFAVIALWGYVNASPMHASLSAAGRASSAAAARVNEPQPLPAVAMSPPALPRRMQPIASAESSPSNMELTSVKPPVYVNGDMDPIGRYRHFLSVVKAFQNTGENDNKIALDVSTRVVNIRKDGKNNIIRKLTDEQIDEYWATSDRIIVSSVNLTRFAAHKKTTSPNLELMAVIVDKFPVFSSLKEFTSDHSGALKAAKCAAIVNMPNKARVHLLWNFVVEMDSVLDLVVSPYWYSYHENIPGETTDEKGAWYAERQIDFLNKYYNILSGRADINDDVGGGHAFQDALTSAIFKRNEALALRILEGKWEPELIIRGAPGSPCLPASSPLLVAMGKQLDYVAEQIVDRIGLFQEHFDEDDVPRKQHALCEAWKNTSPVFMRKLLDQTSEEDLALPCYMLTPKSEQAKLSRQEQGKYELHEWLVNGSSFPNILYKAIFDNNVELARVLLESKRFGRLDEKKGGAQSPLTYGKLLSEGSRWTAMRELIDAFE
jgi:hypothetical protein